jgi:hypothetical protein
MHVEKVHEFESYKQLPKFTHVPLAVIHPSPRKQKSIDNPPPPEMTMSGSQAKINVKRYVPKQIPDHLMRAPIDSGLSVSSPKRS